MIEKVPLLIDTDPGCDDALALMLAIRSNRFDIKAITTVAGNTTIEKTTRNAQYLLKLLQKEEIPVYSGASKPLSRELILAEVHGDEGLGEIIPEIPYSLTQNAPERIVSLVESFPEIILIALGPLTNIAAAIRLNSEIMKKVKKLVIMGGAINVEGNKNRVAEFNMFIDPEAAEIVLNFSIKKVFVPLDVCNTAPLFPEDLERINNPPLKETLKKILWPYMDKLFERENGIKAALMYDPLTMYYLINPDAFTLKSYDLRIETQGNLTRGMTVPERRIKMLKENNVEVAMAVSAEAFKEDFIAILSEKTLSETI